MHYLMKSQYIFDVREKKTFSGFIEVKDGKIAGTFCADESVPLLPVKDYGEQMILPGLIDAHMHFYLSALIHQGVMKEISGHSEEEVARKAADLPEAGGWKIGIGWYSSDFGQHVYPSRHSLDRYCPDVSVLLISGDAHTIWLNTKALLALNITEETLAKNIAGDVQRDEEGLTGVFLEAIAIYYLAEVFALFKKQAQKVCTEYMKALSSYGITAIGDVALTGESPDDLVYPELYQQIEKDAPVRISFFPAMRENVSKLSEMYQKYQSAKLQMGGVKQFFDGVTSTHTAYMKEPYPYPFFQGDVGKPLLPVEKMEQLILLANQNGWPIRIHAVGDQAIALTLKDYKKSAEKYPLKSYQYNVVEHLEVMDPQDIPLVCQKQVILSVQPSHVLVGYDTLDDEVGPERAKHMFPFQSFLDAGGILAFGTDSPVVLNVTPLESIYAACVRKNAAGEPKEGISPEECIDIREALYAHTKGAAKALSRNDIGEIAAGYWADFAILDRNLLDCSLEEIKQAVVTATYSAGQIVYSV